MTEQCMICNELKETSGSTIRLTDDNGDRVEISGHTICTDGLMEQIKRIEDFKKKRMKTVLKELGFLHLLNSK
ncbi:hypothetical protein LCM23_13240 [Cytobacillus kochii]|uniref:hypothetical protein n=1 Tax=Cytobacillus kochii TaxID=859143 RepID=UPI001CD5F771|nr:hypothetical protein [Cytobacillus kochii]MCA1027060.1 hypothetical protein [Cytobacillus kochii]